VPGADRGGTGPRKPQPVNRITRTGSATRAEAPGPAHTVGRARAARVLSTSAQSARNRGKDRPTGDFGACEGKVPRFLPGGRRQRRLARWAAGDGAERWTLSPIPADGAFYSGRWRGRSSAERRRGRRVCHRGRTGAVPGALAHGPQGEYRGTAVTMPPSYLGGSTIIEPLNILEDV